MRWRALLEALCGCGPHSLRTEPFPGDKNMYGALHFVSVVEINLHPGGDEELIIEGMGSEGQKEDCGMINYSAGVATIVYRIV